MKKSLKKLFSTFLIASGVVSILAAIIFQIFQAIVFPFYGAWGILHYYIGAKYLSETGYFNFYSCVLEADKKTFGKLKVVRDLRTYKLVDPKILKRCPRDNFSTSRWSEFESDVKTITGYSSVNNWHETVLDKGFNPPPSWVVVAGPLANATPVNIPLAYFSLFNLDLLFLGLSGVLVWLYMGRSAGIVTLLLTFIYFGTLGRLGNNYLQYAWFLFLTLSVITLRSKKYAASGAWLGLASAFQAFPAVFAIPVIIHFLKALFQKKAKNVRNYGFFLMGFGTVLASFFIVSSMYLGRINIWQEWREKIAIHRNYTHGEAFNIGLPSLIGIQAIRDSSEASSYRKIHNSAVLHARALEKFKDIWFVLSLVGLISFLVVTLKSKKVTFGNGYFILYLLLSLSPYYYLGLSLVPVMVWDNSVLVRRAAIIGSLTLFLLHLIFFGQYYFTETQYLVQSLTSEILIFSFLTLLLVLQFKTDKRN